MSRLVQSSLVTGSWIARKRLVALVGWHAGANIQEGHEIGQERRLAGEDALVSLLLQAPRGEPLDTMRSPEPIRALALE